ncbi:MAG: hypoxanthine phosphoribosyltransferase [Muribaculaceae bacterium]|nr:hypoxanthine phosphoribosyltransferase [Muribaculaceae bacterium]
MSKSQISYEGYTFVPYIKQAEIEARIAELGKQITEEYKGRVPVMICVLNGAFPFASDLFRKIEGDAEIGFIRVSSYCGTQSTGVVKEVVPLTMDIEGRDVIVVEDIVDTGHTIVKLLDVLGARKPASIKVATLLFKPEALQHDITPDYVGFSIPKKFIIGFGLDINNLGRNLSDIWVVAE